MSVRTSSGLPADPYRKDSAWRRGWRNKYRKGVPRFERWLKDIDLTIQYTLKRWRRGKDLPFWYVFPHYPSRGSTLYKVSQLLNVELSNRIWRKPDLCVYYEYGTTLDEGLSFPFAGNMTVLNQHLRSIDKVELETLHQSVFGYGTALDPTTYTGLGVQKGRINALHDGTVVQFPLATVEHDRYIYQRLIDNQHDDLWVKDLRVVIVGASIPLVYIKYRKLSERFLNSTEKVVVVSADEVLQTHEQQQIMTLMQMMGIDFAELDVLRDKNSQLIYVVDVNNTPQGPPKGIDKQEGERAIRLIAAAFEEQFLKN